MMEWRLVFHVVVALALLALAPTACGTPGGVPPSDERTAAARPNPPEPGGAAFEWPQQETTEAGEVTFYPAQLERWEGDRLVERMVVSVAPSPSRTVYGLVWIDARTSVDPQSGLITFRDASVSRTSFPSAPELAGAAAQAVRQNMPRLLQPMPREQLRAMKAVAEAERARGAPRLRNAPPRILFSASPAVLVLVDGDPVLRATDEQDLLRVVNTRALMLFDERSGSYFFYLGDRWMRAKSLKGPWAVAQEPPSALESAKREALRSNQVDLLNAPGSRVMKELAAGRVPEVRVSTIPADLLQSRGAPAFQSIEGTGLLFVSNSDDDIFLDRKSQSFYVLLSGRWYRAASLNGPWRYVSARKLPADFARIPPNHRKGSVLASVAGTHQAQEAAIVSEVPQTARVDRNQTTLKVRYDGEPRFEPIEDTSLRYAVNTPVPVIQAGKGDYYAVSAGVWFHADSPDGPWKVATEVPPAIYKIPPSSPLYYVTFVRLYGSTPSSVYAGYTPGYLGSYCCSDGVVVIGTGYYYPPWIGTFWIGPAVTFGYYPWWGPWWGPWWVPGWGWTSPVYTPYAVPPPPPAPPVPPAAPPPNLYTGWSGKGVRSASPESYNQAYLSQPGWGARQPSVGNAPAISPGAPSPGRAGTLAPESSAPWNPPSVPSARSWGPSIGGGPSVPAMPAPAMPAPAMPAPAAPAISRPFSGGGWGARR